MKGIPTIRLKPARLGRVALLMGASAAVVGGSLLGATAAHAADVGSGPGLTFNPTSGAVTMTGNQVAYSSPACPSGFQGSAVLHAINSDGTFYNVSGANNSVAAAFSGTLLAAPITMAQVRDNGDIGPGGVQEIVVDCFAGVSASGASQNFVDAHITWSADGNSWSSAAVTTEPTATTLSVSPNPVSAGSSVTLTAHVAVTDGTGNIPTGSVTFSVGGSAIGSPVTLDATGTATTSTSISTSGTVQLTAAYTPTGSFGASSSPQVPLNVLPAGGLSEPVTVAVGATGSFNISVAPGTVTLAPDSAQATASGTAQPVTVTDTRNTFPGWSVSGQAVDFTPTSSPKPFTIPAANLGWTPTGTLTDASLGPVVAPNSPGLGTAAVWASAAAGHGNTAAAGDTISANLLLKIPTSAPAATYNSALSISFTQSAP